MKEQILTFKKSYSTEMWLENKVNFKENKFII